MHFTPKTKEELQNEAAIRAMFPAGRYAFEVHESSDGKGKESGKEYVKLRLTVFVGDEERTVYDYLTEAMPEKMHSFCEATGLMAEYTAGDLSAEDCAGKQGFVYIAQQKAKNGYPAKNVAREYFAGDGVEDSDLPF